MVGKCHNLYNIQVWIEKEGVLPHLKSHFKHSKNCLTARIGKVKYTIYEGQDSCVMDQFLECFTIHHQVTHKTVLPVPAVYILVILSVFTSTFNLTFLEN